MNTCQKKGISVCYDVESFPYGSNYIEEATRIIENQIRCFILILTPRTLERCANKDVDPVYNELMIALSKYRKEMIHK